jgi:pyruvate/2-oxoglutarate dehydrogenase complex dihydrolipoamide acyltransferase (E2) component
MDASRRATRSQFVWGPSRRPRGRPRARPSPRLHRNPPPKLAIPRADNPREERVNACRACVSASPSASKEAQHSAAMLTTFNEVDMTAMSWHLRAAKFKEDSRRSTA